MNETTTTNITTEVVEGQLDMFTGEVVEAAQEEAVFDLTALVTESSYTAYKIYTLINKIGTQLGVGELVSRPQMMYNYARNGLIVKGFSVKHGTYYSREFTRTEVIEFVTKFVNKKISK